MSRGLYVHAARLAGSCRKACPFAPPGLSVHAARPSVRTARFVRSRCPACTFAGVRAARLARSRRTACGFTPHDLPAHAALLAHSRRTACPFVRHDCPFALHGLLVPAARFARSLAFAQLGLRVHAAISFLASTHPPLSISSLICSSMSISHVKRPSVSSISID